MSKEALIQFIKEFPIQRDRRRAEYKDNKKRKEKKIRDGTDVMDPFPSPFHPQTKKCLHQDSVA